MPSERNRENALRNLSDRFLPRPDELWLTQNQEHPDDPSDGECKAQYR
jgi:hypothetical protein